MDLIDRNALLNNLKESVNRAREWKEEAQDEEIKIRAEQAHATFIECALRVKSAPAVNRWIPCSAMPETTNGEWLRSLPDNELTKYLNISAICMEIVKEGGACQNCTCGDCIRMWLNRKRGKE